VLFSPDSYSVIRKGKNREIPALVHSGVLLLIELGLRIVQLISVNGWRKRQGFGDLAGF
jgi:hypothetical protein